MVEVNMLSKPLNRDEWTRLIDFGLNSWLNSRCEPFVWLASWTHIRRILNSSFIQSCKCRMTAVINRTADHPRASVAAWIDGRGFDLTLIHGVAALALFSGAVVSHYPGLFLSFLFADLWLLGYHHVIATFTRLAFDRESLSEHRFLVFVLPWIVLAGTIGVAASAGTWAIATLYFYWQWFHYTRQSYGIARVYMRKAQVGLLESRVAIWAIYLVPAFGIFHRSQQFTPFLGLRIKMLPIMMVEYLHLPVWFVFHFMRYTTIALAVAALVCVAWCLLLQLRALRRGEPRGALMMYLASHFVIFYVGYCGLAELNHGWLVINIWHNAQYILFVWWYNTKRFQKGVTTKQHFLSWLSQRSLLNACSYFAFTLTVSTVIYFCVTRLLKVEPFAAIPAAMLITFQAVNFHHYLVDGLIWKVRKKQLQKTMSIAPSTSS